MRPSGHCMIPFADYVAQIGFHTIQPDTPTGDEWWGSSFDDMAQVELANIRLPKTDVTPERLHALADIPRMSTFANAVIINYGVSCMAEHTCYLNIGVWQGFSFLAGMLGNPEKRCIGVDNFSMWDRDPSGHPAEPQFRTRFAQAKSSTHQFYKMDYAEYLQHVHTQPIRFYFYDGDHSYMNQLQGLRLAEPFFTDDCIIVVDDTNWPAPRNATLDFIANSTHQYQILLDRRTVEEGGHPTFWNGIIVFQRTGVVCPPSQASSVSQAANHLATHHSTTN